MLCTERVPGSVECPRLTVKGSEVDRVMSFPRGPIRLPTDGDDDPERQRNLGMMSRARVVMRLLLGRTPPLDFT